MVRNKVNDEEEMRRKKTLRNLDCRMDNAIEELRSKKLHEQLTEWPNISGIDGDETGGVQGEQGIVQSADLPAVSQQALGRHTESVTRGFSQLSL